MARPRSQLQPQPQPQDEALQREEQPREHEKGAFSVPSSHKEGKEQNARAALTATAVRNAIPAVCFQKNVLISLMYMGFDMSVLATALWVYPHVHGVLGHLLYWNVYGFIAWALFVVGHDCGHGSFSDSSLANAVFGHLCHAPLLVPFYPWARSHKQHHMYHNHKDKDRSHPWLTDDEMKAYPLIMQLILPTFIGPLAGFWIYLFWGMAPDGSHIVWFGRLYEGASTGEKIKAMLSTALVGLWAYAVWQYCDRSLALWWGLYGGVIAVCYLWLFMVTWFQHHNEDTLVYSQSEWTFVKGALETVDRFMGFGLDAVHHNITDGHVVHHFFFREIPHFRLAQATAALRTSPLAKQNPGLFKLVDHSAYPLKFVVDFARSYSWLGYTGWNWAAAK
jgi:acyl-lipid omega-3 desaturase